MKYSLLQCVWEITLACCFSCRYCGSSGGCARENELTTEECLNVAEQLADMGCRRVSLIGGEIFLRSDWADICRALSARGVAVNIVTNGFLFTDEIISELKSFNVESVSVSLDCLEEVHDKYRQAGSFRRAVNAIEALSSNGITVSVITTLNSENAAYLREFYSFLSTLPVVAWQLQACFPMGNAAKDFGYRFDFSDVTSFVAETAPHAPFIMGIGDSIGYFTPGEGMLRGNLSGEAIFRGCGAGIISAGIDSVGNVRGCESLQDDKFIEGNLREKTLKEIWDSPDAFAYNRKFTPSMLTGGCRDCPNGPVCAGGCRAYNYFVHGKLHENPACPNLFKGKK